MNEMSSWILAVLGGAACGAFYFGGLWWTIRAGLQSSNPALWFGGSLLLRTGCVIAAILWLSHGDWRRMLACLTGFFGMRVASLIAARGSQSSAAPSLVGIVP